MNEHASVQVRLSQFHFCLHAAAHLNTLGLFPFHLFIAQRAYRVFRTLGLRHLIVTNTHNQVLGMVTRHDLVSTHYLASSHGGSASTSGRDRDRGLNSSSATLTSWSSGNSLDSAGSTLSAADGLTRERRRSRPQRLQKQRASRVRSINSTIGVDLSFESSIDV